ncbi:hypothetical protein JKP88DRAFT_352271 [Tribonema minus]|uniref:Uncharacterized protein n=1 Tax=Tribonema minus TaxID=303371 RepID=A0A835ZMQ3_9STRA|nr:hypothetical protein JKP88DRAFT_352271 [Tribonema minus]
MWELDPFAVLGPAGVIQKGQFFSAATMLRTCSDHKPNADVQPLINEYLYDTKPSYTVSSASDLQQQMDDCDFGDCILITADKCGNAPGNRGLPPAGDTVLAANAMGTALTAFSSGIVAEDCVVMRSGVAAVVRDEGPSSSKGFLSMRGCTLEDNAWGAFFGKDTPADVQRAVLAANTFRRNCAKDISECGYTGQRVQPWRRGWDSAKP